MRIKKGTNFPEVMNRIREWLPDKCEWESFQYKDIKLKNTIEIKEVDKNG